ncbi:MAG: DUF975 family protein [Paludibacteraceae bacterium]|nr:DUF975 family protein [Paludibacteraceae bacterium]MBN2788358.1 DUF975 family protein [Paludibacteraceae bacterium]
MQTENKVLMEQAKESLKDKWGLAIGTFLVYMLLAGSISAIPTIGGIFSLLISGPLSLGITIFSLHISRNQEARLEQIFEGFKEYTRTLITYLLVLLYVFVRLLLLIVPGIIAGISYSMTFYILADDKTIEPKDAILKSKEMMEGYKLKFFYLGLRFLVWGLLCILTLGVGFLWLFPWINTTIAKFYDDIKDNTAIQTA